MAKKFILEDLYNGICDGNIAVLSRAITLIESSKREHRQLANKLIDLILPHTGKSIRVGITGVPGVGKSTFIESFGMHLIHQRGKKVAVLAIDPSSTLTKGSILGDKTRMEKLSINPNAFIRPTASSGSLGGVAYRTREVSLLCEAAGFDVVIVETVGVGQSETEVSNITDFFLLLMLAGAGDELQGIKRGIMEMADGLAITKADGANEEKAKAARTEYAKALHFLPRQPSGWVPKVKSCSAYNNTGISDIWTMIEDFVDHHVLKGYFHANRDQQNIKAFNLLLNDRIYEHFLIESNIQEQIESLKNEIIKDNISPFSAVEQIIKKLN